MQTSNTTRSWFMCNDSSVVPTARNGKTQSAARRSRWPRCLDAREMPPLRSRQSIIDSTTDSPAPNKTLFQIEYSVRISIVIRVSDLNEPWQCAATLEKMEISSAFYSQDVCKLDFLNNKITIILLELRFHDKILF